MVITDTDWPDLLPVSNMAAGASAYLDVALSSS